MSSFLFRLEFERRAIHAEAQAGRLRSIREDVTQMAAAGRAQPFVARHAKTAICLCRDRTILRLVKARPAGAALILRLRAVKRRAAAGAEEFAGALFVVQRARSGGLGAVAAQHVILLRRQLRLPV